MSVSPRTVEIHAQELEIPERWVTIPERKIEIIGDDGQPREVVIPARDIKVEGQKVGVPGRVVNLDGNDAQQTQFIQQQEVVQQPVQQVVERHVPQVVPVQQQVVYQQPQPVYQQPQQVVYQQPQQVVYQQPQQVVYQQPILQQQPFNETQRDLPVNETLTQTQSWSPTHSTGGKKYAPITAPEPIEYDINAVRAQTKNYNLNNGVRSIDNSHNGYGYLTEKRGLSPTSTSFDHVHMTGAPAHSR